MAAAQKKVMGIAQSMGQSTTFHPDVMAAAAKSLNDQEFGTLYGFPKTSVQKASRALKQLDLFKPSAPAQPGTGTPTQVYRKESRNLQEKSPPQEREKSPEEAPTPSSEPKDAEAGLETAPMVPEPEAEPQSAMEPTESVIGKALTGRSLRTVSFEIEPGQSTMTIEIVGLENASVLTHKRDGTITWQHRGQTKTFRPTGSPERPKPKSDKKKK
jgi:hypothetical protein